MEGQTALILQRADEDGVTTLTLNRPKAFNSLSRELLTAIEHQLDIIAGDASIRVVILAGNGKAFCAGHDLKEMGSDRTHTAISELFQQCSRIMVKLTKLPQPVIAKIDGIATAAGCQLVAACDLAICSDQSRFATSGVKYGLFCSTPMVALSRNISRKPAMEMLLTGDFIDAQTALSHGLVNDVVASDELDVAVNSLCDRLLDKPGPVLALGKRAFYQQLEMGLEDAYAFASEVIVNNALGVDFEEGLKAFVEKRAPQWPKPS